MRAAHALLEHVKASGVTGRRFSGVATSPETDRVGDVIEMAGVKFAAEIPLLLHHDPREPVGVARLGPVTPNGIAFDAEIPDIAEAGATRDRCNAAAVMVKHGLLKAVSIGFRVLESAAERLANGGMRFTKIEVMELSLVSIPANQSATIDVVRGIYRGLQPVAPPPVVAATPAPALVKAKPWAPPPEYPDMHSAWRQFFHVSGIAPKAYRHEERTILADEQYQRDPGGLSDEDIAYMAFMTPEVAIRAYQDRDKARREAQARVVERRESMKQDHDEFFVTRKALNEAVAALTSRLTALEKELGTTLTPAPPKGQSIDADALQARLRKLISEALADGAGKS